MFLKRPAARRPFSLASRLSVRAAHVGHEHAAQRNLPAPTRVKLIVVLLDQRDELQPVEQANVGSRTREIERAR
jgi:hypothetical protein